MKEKKDMDDKPVCPACGAAYYRNMFCLGYLDWHIANYPDPERVEIVRRLGESVINSARIRIEPVS